MKKVALTLVALLMAVLPAFSDSVSVQTAQRVAQSFLNSKMEGNPQIHLIDFAEKTFFPDFYVFGNEQCFVIIAGDDCVHPVLGYSTEGGFGNGTMPDCVSDWLKAYTYGIAAVKESRLDATAEIRSEWEMLLNGRGLEPKSRTHVEPLVQTHWNQGAPYNVLCPVEPTHSSGHTPAGCGATAMAQIMKYWGRPIRGVGSNTYTPRDHPQYGELTVDFSNTVYDWDNMPNSINQNSPQAQIDAVATLIYHCGVSVNMDYGWPSGSSVHGAILDDAFRNHFNYASDHNYMFTDYLYKSDTTDEGWILMLKNELDNSRPLLYRGATESGGGHLFVCDGYDENDYFHMNWGWSGSHDGYYAIGALHPTPTVDYSYANAAVFYCAPNYSITASVIPSAAGVVVGEGDYPMGSLVTLNAVGSPGFAFSHWDDGSTQNPRTIQVTDDLEVVAYFVLIPYTITTTADPNNGGTVSGGGTYNYGQNCTVTATPNANYTFTNWTENGIPVSTEANYTFAVTGNRDLVAHFQLQSFTITATADPSNGGAVAGGGTYNYGQTCMLTAIPATGYEFVNWTKNGTQVSTNTNYSFTVTESAAYVAHFQSQSFTITATADPSNGGTVAGGGTYYYGQTCALTATPATGYEFINWTKNGTQVSTNTNYSFTVTESAAYVAHFQLQSFTVTATSDPSNGGTVSGGGTYNYGQTCTLSATPATGYEFVNWTKNGTQVSTNASYTFTVTESAYYVAHFQLLTYTISVSANPTSGGMVTGGGTYSYGQSCTIVATANPGFIFLNWTKDGSVVSTEANYSFTVTDSATYIAHFTVQTYTVTVAANPTEGGTVSGGGSFTYGQTCTVYASSNTCYVFDNWTENGSIVDSLPDYSFTVTNNRNLVANFSIEIYEITAEVNPIGGGVVIGSGSYPCGETVRLIAEPNDNYIFLHWTENDNIITADSILQFIATGARHLVANFIYYDSMDENVMPVEIYPNPANDILTIRGEGIHSVTVFNMAGQSIDKVDADAVETLILNVNNYEAGTYLLLIQSEYGSLRKVFVKK